MSLDTAIAGHPLRLARFEFPVDGTEATKQASSNFERNRAAFERRWPRTVMALPETLPELEWLFARDGALSGRHVDGRWFNDVSVPKRAAERMLKTISTVGTTSVHLAPTHACQVRRVLDHLPTTHAVIAIIPGELAAGVTMACEDFSADINAGRLWVAAGPDWLEELKAILDGNEGLMPPQTMIRVPGLNAAVLDHVQRPVDSLLSTHAKNHKQLLVLQLAKPRNPRRPVQRVCVVSSSYGLWNDAGQLLGEAATKSTLECVTLDVSSPLQASELKLARSIEGCDALVTPHVGRADRPGIVPEDVAWITWVTGQNVPQRVASAKYDRLVIADEAMRPVAHLAGWTNEHIGVACESWRGRPGHDGLPALDHGRHVRATPTIVFDLKPIIVPAQAQEMSSLRLVWELAERELIQRPLVARPGVENFLLACADRVGVPREGFPVALFRDALVVPTFARELAIELDRRGVEFSIFGDGWQTLPQLAGRWRGAVRSAEEFATCLASASGLIDVWPGLDAHPARRTGLPTIEPWGRTASAVLSDLSKPGRAIVTGRTPFALDTIVAQVSNL